MFMEESFSTLSKDFEEVESTLANVNVAAFHSILPCHTLAVVIKTFP